MAEPSPRFQERAVKRARVEAILGARGLEAVLITDPGTVSWYLCGARSHVVSLADAGVAAVLAGRDREEVRTSVIEAPRLAQEELGEGAPPIVAVPWWIPLDADLGVTRGALGSDGPVAGAADVAADLLAARAALTPPEVDRYRALGRDTAAAAGEALRGARAEEREWTLAGRAARALLERGCEVLVLLVAGAERLPRHRHPLPTDAPLGDRAMLVVGARRHGLVCSVTRMRAFAPLDAAARARYRALLDVEAAGLAATGYATRDVLATPATREPVRSGQAFAWNPSGGGFKVEDTVLATEDGVEILSPDPEWPAVDVAGRDRPDVLA